MVVPADTAPSRRTRTLIGTENREAKVIGDDPYDLVAAACRVERPRRAADREGEASEDRPELGVVAHLLVGAYGQRPHERRNIFLEFVEEVAVQDGIVHASDVAGRCRGHGRLLPVSTAWS
jgi:hypothetical protein